MPTSTRTIRCPDRRLAPGRRAARRNRNRSSRTIRRRCPVAADDVVMRTEKLTKIYPGGLKAVDELDLEVHQGEIFGLLGPNGAGKTTTAGMLTTRVIPTSGSAFVGGIDVVAHPTAAKRVIGVVPQ